MKITEEELYEIIGGATKNISGTLINSVCKLIELLLDLGRNIGSAIRYNKSNITCTK